jgi:hypothetical protein
MGELPEREPDDIEGDPPMPYRTKQLLESWLEEFRSTREGGGLITVLLQDGADGADTGLVVVPLRNDSIEVYMQPVAIGHERWTVAISPRADPVELDAGQLHALAAELEVAASLCAFLQERSSRYTGDGVTG